MGTNCWGWPGYVARAVVGVVSRSSVGPRQRIEKREKALMGIEDKRSGSALIEERVAKLMEKLVGSVGFLYLSFSANILFFSQ